jgi:glycosyltransferase involved in cell wall biosynthesis
MQSHTTEILISTKNRCDDLLFTLAKIDQLLNENVSCVVFDDGSVDNTYEKVKEKHPQLSIRRNEQSKGYLYCRNVMLNESTADIAISLDDDAHFLIDNPIEIIHDYFLNNPQCGLIAFRILWSKTPYEAKPSDEKITQVQGYVGCGHAWNMKAWHKIPNYPEWFEFYGEETFAALQLFKKRIEIHYLPQLFIQHRVDLKQRTIVSNDFSYRHRRSLRACWFNYFLFFPFSKIPKLMLYSLWMQFRNKIFKGNVKVVKPLFLAIFDILITLPKLIKHRNSLTSKEYNAYLKLNDAKIYWKPEN